MADKTIYLKMSAKVKTEAEAIRIGDMGKIYCEDIHVTNKIKTLKDEQLIYSTDYQKLIEISNKIEELELELLEKLEKAAKDDLSRQEQD